LTLYVPIQIKSHFQHHVVTYSAQAAQGDARKQLSAVAEVNIPSEIMFIALILVMLMFLGPLSQLLGGSLFNPCDVATLYARGKCNLSSFFIRSVAQVAGALSGAIAASKFLPTTWALRGQALVATTQPGIDVIGGASSEFLLTYLVSLLVMATQRSFRGRFIKYCTPLVVTAAALKVGTRYTGPVLNPAAALSWTYLYWNKQPLSVMQHIIVFWVAPVAAAVLATWTDMGMQAANANAVKKTAARVKTD
jgi:glycerol uptake facilitator-like aquaporin